MVKNGLVLATVGAAIGLVGAFVLVTLLGHILPALPGRDPGVVVCAASLLVAVAVIACWLPARKMTRVNPIIALQAQ